MNIVEKFLGKLRKRILSHCAINPTSGCWEWTSSITYRGYGQIQVCQSPEYAHRVSWEVFQKEPIGDSFVLHKCDNRKCVNPDHLFLGSHSDNMHDMATKGRAASGVRNGAHTHPETRARGERSGRRVKPESYPRVNGETAPNSKLSNAQALEIFQAQGTYDSIAAHYKISRTSVANIKRGRAYQDATQS